MLHPKQCFILTDEPAAPPRRSWLLFLVSGLSTAWCWTITSPESCITAHQSVLKLICQPLRRDKTMSLTTGSVMEGHAWRREWHQAFLCWGKLWGGNESSGHVTKTPGDSGWVEEGHTCDQALWIWTDDYNEWISAQSPPFYCNLLQIKRRACCHKYCKHHICGY